jgi:hypothetical protein
VYITMYLNDHSRSDFYGALGLNTTQFNRHVILETNNATARVFPEVRRRQAGFGSAACGVQGSQEAACSQACSIHSKAAGLARALAARCRACPPCCAASSLLC